MCGFVSFFGQTSVGDASWNRSLKILDCRGPDSSGEFRSSGAQFGHKRLSIIGIGSSGVQPIHDEESVLIFNGEIYNFRDLARDLDIAAYSDSQVLFEILKRDARAWLPRIRGMYSFVHYNRQSGLVMAARDPFGIKPLYFHLSDSGSLAVGSTAASLAELLGSSTPDPVAAANFLAWGFIPEGRSMFEGIQKAPSGCLLAWEREGTGYRSYSRERIRNGPWDLVEVPSALDSSVAAHLVSDVEVGVFLSGGIDSTLLASFAIEHNANIQTFSLTNSRNPHLNEGSIAAHNARLLGSRHHEVDVSPEAMALEAAGIIRSSGEPFGDAAFLPLALLSAAAASQVKVALAGEGADELFGGYRRYDVERFLQSPIGKILNSTLKHLPLDHLPSSRHKQVSRILRALAAQSEISQHAELMDASWDAMHRLRSPSVTAAWRELYEHWAFTPQDPWSYGLPRNRAFDLRTWLPNVFLEKSDRASMVHSLEVRTPYLDPVVARAACQSSPRDTRKQPLRRLLYERMPGVRLPARKMGLGVNLSEVTPKFRGQLEFLLQSEDSILRIFEGANIEKVFSEEMERSSVFQFRLAMLGLWQEAWCA